MLRKLISHYPKWILISALIGILSGLASALFLASLNYVTNFRDDHTWLLFLMPVGGLIVGLLYHCLGKDIEAGNNLLIEHCHDPKETVPLKMAPLILVGTLITHLFGGSAGREGTAVQMGGSIADQFKKVFKLKNEDRKRLLMAGMAGGFASVFGVPFAGLVFGLEVLTVGKLHFEVIVECAIAAFVANHVTLACGIHHTDYPQVVLGHAGLAEISSAVVAGLCFGLVARIFVITTEGVSKIGKRYIPLLPVRATLAGIIISLIYFFIPLTTRYAGLGIPIIQDSLHQQIPAYDGLAKLLMTAFTLGLGFKGGEVTPLLFIGATVGNALTHLLPLSISVLASLGFVAVFAGAANTPIACAVMAVELFGGNIAAFAIIACFASYAASGPRGIYHSQRGRRPKVL